MIELKSEADKLFSEIVRSLGYCEAKNWGDISCSDEFHAAHIFTRKRTATRCDFKNAFCLCFNHHRRFHDRPKEFNKFIESSWAQPFYHQTQRKSLLYTKVDWGNVVNYLTRVKDGELTLQQVRNE